MTRCWCVAVTLALGFTASACVERDEDHFPAQELPEMGAPMSSQGDMGLGEGEGAGTMSGTWLLVHENSTCVLRQEQLTLADYLVDIEQQGQTLVERRRICALDLSPVLGLDVGVPEAAFSSVVFPEIDRGVISLAREGGGYTSSTELALWGLELDDPVEDPLPEELDAPEIVDSDGDGNPGVTFILGDDTCDRYTIQRQFVRYQGLLAAPNRVEGTSVTYTESRAVGGSKPICRSAPPITANDRYNTFVMVRVDGQGGAFDADADGDGEVTCDEVRGLGAMLNPGREADNDRCKN